MQRPVSMIWRRRGSNDLFMVVTYAIHGAAFAATTAVASALALLAVDNHSCDDHSDYAKYNNRNDDRCDVIHNPF